MQDKETVFDQEANGEKLKRPVTKKVSKKAIKASAACASTPRKKLQKKTTESTMKPSPAREEEKLNEEPPVDKGEEDLATLKEASKAEAGESPPSNPFDRLRVPKGLVEVPN